MRRIEEYCDRCGKLMTEHRSSSDSFGVFTKLRGVGESSTVDKDGRGWVNLSSNKKTSCGSSSFANDLRAGAFCSIQCFLLTLTEDVNTFLERDIEYRNYKLLFTVSNPDSKPDSN